MWIQVTDQIVKRQGETQCSARPDAIDYEVASIPAIEEGESLLYNGTAFSIEPNYAERKAKLEPSLLAAYRKWQDAIVLTLPCVGDCEAAYLEIKAQYDALAG
jgi:hypothetical protein